MRGLATALGWRDSRDFRVRRPIWLVVNADGYSRPRHSLELEIGNSGAPSGGSLGGVPCPYDQNQAAGGLAWWQVLRELEERVQMQPMLVPSLRQGWRPSTSDTRNC
jgi:hypothetical protein